MLINSHPSKFPMESSASHLDTTWATMMSKFLWSSDHHLRYFLAASTSLWQKVPVTNVRPGKSSLRESWSTKTRKSPQYITPARFPHPTAGLAKKWSTGVPITMSGGSSVGDDHVPTQWDAIPWVMQPKKNKPQKCSNPWDDQTASLLENSQKKVPIPRVSRWIFPWKPPLIDDFSFFSQPETSIKSSPSSTRSQARTPSW